MSRRHITFPCEGSTLAATLDGAPGRTGLLIVTGTSVAPFIYTLF